MRAASGTPTRVPYSVAVHLVAARYGQSPRQVRAWDAEDLLEACAIVAAAEAAPR